MGYLTLKHLYFDLILVIFGIYFAAAILVEQNAPLTCDSTCYQSVNNLSSTLPNLLQQFKNFTNVATYNPYFQTNSIENLTNIFKNLSNTAHKQIRNLKKIEKKLDPIKNTIKTTNTTILELEERIKNITGPLEDLKKLKSLLEKPMKNCDNAKKKFFLLKTETDKLWSDLNSVKNISTLKNRIETCNNNTIDIFNERVNQKHKLEKLNIPEEVYGNYILDLEKKCETQINYLLNNSHLLENLLKGFYKNRNKKLKTEINKLNVTINNLRENNINISEEIHKYSNQIEKRDLNITDEIIQIIRFVELRKDFAKTKDFIEGEVNNLNKEMAKIKEYTMFINEFTKEKRNEIRREIESFTTVTDYTKEHENIKKDIEFLANVTNEFCNYSKTIPIES